MLKEREELESYVIRIYRRTDGDPPHLAGIIEIVENGRQRRFSDMRELWEILAGSGARRTAPATKRAPRDR